MKSWLRITAALLLACGAATACEKGGGITPPDTIVPPPPPVPAPPVVMVGAGDISDCANNRDELTAALIDDIPGLVYTVGDNVYPDGSPDAFDQCYKPTWGRHRNRTRPSVGNHEYLTPNAAGYFNYFGAAAGDPSKGYYSYNYGRWHVVVLNSNLPLADTSAQQLWLRQDLAANGKFCTLAYFHHARFSSGANHGSHAWLEPAWRVMYELGVDLVLSAHEHVYERFAPQTPAGSADPEYGIRQFTLGMGGSDSTSSYGFATPLATSEFRDGSYPGVLKLALDSADYRWEYITAPDARVRDSGRGTCHDPSPTAYLGAATTSLAAPPRDYGRIELDHEERWMTPEFLSRVQRAERELRAARAQLGQR